MANKYMEKLTSLLEQGLETYACSDKYKDLLKTMSKFYTYSAGNCLLILTQCPDASYVAGYGSWKTYFNRYVKQGAKAIYIKAPCKYKKKTEDGEDEDRLGFKAAHVFDISDTEPIPGTPSVAIGVDNLSGSVNGFSDLIQCLEFVSSVPVSYENVKRKANGYYTEKDEARIVIKSGMSEVQTVKTLIHEISHAELHNSARTKTEKKKGKEQKELEAESVAFIVCHHYNIDTSDYSFPYVLGWAGETFKDILQDSMSDIQKTAAKIINGIDEHMRTLAVA